MAMLILTTYGRSSGFCIDPIEKKPLNNFYPGSSILSFGTAGCNLACKFCQNWDISKSRDMDRLMDDATPQAIAQAARQTGARSVAFTYNDPVIFAEYAMDTADACHALGIKAVAVTAGYMHLAPAREFYAKMDAANIDLKAFSDEFYVKLCGAKLQAGARPPRHGAPRDRLLGRTDHPADSRQERFRCRTQGARRLGGEGTRPRRAIHFSAFHPDWKMSDIPATPPATLARARHIAMDAGLRYVYTGNVHDKAGDATHCPGCGKVVIQRDWYNILAYALDDSGHCRQMRPALPRKEFAGRYGTGSSAVQNDQPPSARIDLRIRRSGCTPDSSCLQAPSLRTPHWPLLQLPGAATSMPSAPMLRRRT
jgi:pyruvate formate lyase activating enzyme